LRVFEEATTKFINGDASAWKELASQSDDGTVMGAWGAYEKGWTHLEPRYDRAAARFQPSGANLHLEYLSADISGHVAYTVTIERSQVLLTGQEKIAPMTLRVTHVFRKEDGVWKILHRHADSILEKTATAAVLQS
jgi:ketosteroid isomerase-like protein